MRTRAIPTGCIKLLYTGPARRAGEALHGRSTPSIRSKQPRRAWQYLPGQRRVKLAPDLAYDTPNPGTAGAATYDDVFVFNGAMDRFDWKLVGKKEMYVPYNSYRLIVRTRTRPTCTKPNHLNPDFVRWELHRVWVVEATLKPGKRHIYSKRVFYLDEDSWAALASDQYDARGQLYRSSFAYLSYSYDVQAPYVDKFAIYDFSSGAYNITGLFGPHNGLQVHDRAAEAIAPGRPRRWPARECADGDSRRLHAGHARQRRASRVVPAIAAGHSDFRIMITCRTRTVGAALALARRWRRRPIARRLRRSCSTRRRAIVARSRAERCCKAVAQAPAAASSRSASAATSSYSTDGGASWQQARVPVSSDLDRRVLRRRQAGLGGRPRRRRSCTAPTAATAGRCSSTAAAANDLLLAAMERKAAARADLGRREGAARRSAALRGAGRRQAVPRRLVRRRQNGYVVGAYNLIFRTATAARPGSRGSTATDNPKFLNLYAIRPAGGELLHRRRRRPAAEARRRGAALPRARRFRTRARLFGVVGARNARRRVRPARQRLPQRRRRRDAGARSTPACRRRSSAATRSSGRRIAARRRGRPRRASSADGGAHLRQGRARQPMPAHRLADIGDGADWRCVGPRGARVARADAAPEPATARTLTWPPFRPRPNRCRSCATSRTSTATRATGSSGWCSTTGCVVVVCARRHAGARLLAATRLALNASFEKMIPQSQPYIKNYLDEPEGPARPRQRAAHRGREHATATSSTRAYLETLKQINDELFLTPGVDRAWVKSLWTPAVRWTEVTEEGFRGGPVMPDNYNGSPQSIEQLKQNIARAGHRRQPGRQRLQVEHDLRAAARQGARHRQAHRLPRPVAGAGGEDPRQVRARARPSSTVAQGVAAGQGPRHRLRQADRRADRRPAQGDGVLRPSRRSSPPRSSTPTRAACAAPRWWSPARWSRWSGSWASSRCSASSSTRSRSSCRSSSSRSACRTARRR